MCFLQCLHVCHGTGSCCHGIPRCRKSLRRLRFGQVILHGGQPRKFLAHRHAVLPVTFSRQGHHCRTPHQGRPGSRRGQHRTIKIPGSTDIALEVTGITSGDFDIHRIQSPYYRSTVLCTKQITVYAVIIARCGITCRTIYPKSTTFIQYGIIRSPHQTTYTNCHSRVCQFISNINSIRPSPTRCRRTIPIYSQRDIIRFHKQRLGCVSRPTYCQSRIRRFCSFNTYIPIGMHF